LFCYYLSWFEIITEIWLGYVRERDHLEDLGLDGKMSEYILKDLDERVCTALFFFIIVTNGEVLYT
jgi:hypothetical protein